MYSRINLKKINKFLNDFQINGQTVKSQTEPKLLSCSELKNYKYVPNEKFGDAAGLPKCYKFFLISGCIILIYFIFYYSV